MSGGALFGNNTTRSGNKNLVEFKAGRMTMKGKMVYPDNRKGLLYVYQSDDALMHFCWKDRTSGVVEDDLIIFPDDCEFKLVPQCKTGRVYLLRFKSSSRKFFFWLQDLKTDKDEEHCRKINEVLNNPPTPGSTRRENPEGDLQNLLNNMSQQQLMQLFGVGGVGSLGTLLGTYNRSQANIRGSNDSSSRQERIRNLFSEGITGPPVSQTPTNTTSTPTATETAVGSGTGSASGSANRIQLSDLQNFLQGINIPSGAEPAAVQSGQAGPMVRQFGLGSEAVNAAATGNIEQFVTALESETNTQPEAQTQEEAPSQPPPESADKKDDDDEEGMALD